MEEPISSVAKPQRWEIFISSFFFVLGFSLIFSIVGVLLQTVLSKASYDVQIWLGRLGGVIIIVFGLYLLGLIKIPFLERDYKFKVRKFRSHYLTSFVFGAAFAVGWTPCVSAALGAILALAATSPGNAFFLLFSYTLGIGIPFLLVGLFTEQARHFIKRIGPVLLYIQYAFGALLILLGVLVFVGQLSRIANLEIVVQLLESIGLTTMIGGHIKSLTIANMVIAFFAGLGSFLSPCILPIIPGFLSYLASTTAKEHGKVQ